MQGQIAKHLPLGISLKEWKRSSGIPYVVSAYGSKCNIRWQHLILTLFSSTRKIVQSCGYIGFLGLAVQSNSSNCLVLIRRTQL